VSGTNGQTTTYAIKLPQFEGPFDLLLFFIERDELNIHDIPISKITDDFLDYIRQMHALNIELAGEFIFVAATLMRIKARMLLPRTAQENAENEVDLKAELTQKLILYKQFKEVCADLRILEDERSRLHARGNIAADNKMARRVADTMEEELASFDLYKLMLAYEKSMSRFANSIRKVTHTVEQYPYTIERQKEAIAELLAINRQLDFRQLAEHSENKVHFVFNFLAMLEMLQQRLLEIELGAGFNSFVIRKFGDLRKI